MTKHLTIEMRRDRPRLSVEKHCLLMRSRLMLNTAGDNGCQLSVLNVRRIGCL